MWGSSSTLMDEIERSPPPGSSGEKLKRQIKSLHEQFLKEDESDRKSHVFRSMSVFMREFLSTVTHDQKFDFKETAAVLQQSAMNVNFDANDGSLAFEYLARYALNLLEQPYRTDFHTLKITSGYYYHNIRPQLPTATEILVAMGYAQADEITLKLQELDVKRLQTLYRDLILASQECIVLGQILKRVSYEESDYCLSIGDVFEFRRNHVGDADRTVKSILADIRRRRDEAANPYSANSKVMAVSFKEDSNKETDDIMEQLFGNTIVRHAPTSEIREKLNEKPTNYSPPSKVSGNKSPISLPINKTLRFVPRRKSHHQQQITDSKNWSGGSVTHNSSVIPNRWASNQKPNQKLSNNPVCTGLVNILKNGNRSTSPSVQPLKISKVSEKENWDLDLGASKKPSWADVCRNGPTMAEPKNEERFSTMGAEAQMEWETSLFERIVEPWNCRICTFRNTEKERDCEICNSPKDVPDDRVYTGPKLYSQMARKNR